MRMNVWDRITGRVQQLVFGVGPEFLRDFASTAKPEFQDLYSGRVADLFFSNTGPVVHKWLHYLPIYDTLLKEHVGTNVRMLEIGVYRGGSLALWRNFLGERATIYGVDVVPECAAYDGQHGRVRIGSQDDPDFLRRVVAEMGGVDIVLDDGSHICSHQRIAFDALFPLLSDGGIYLIEDMHTSYWRYYGGGLRRPGSAIEFLKRKVDELHSHYFHRGMNRDPSTEIESVQFFDSIAAVRKRKQPPRFHVKVGS